MIARRALPPEHLAWNARWGAPFGRALHRRARTGGLLDRTLLTWAPSLRGPFGFQPNNTTREAEYPWAFHATPIAPGMRVLEIGGGLSGFQFVLDRSGCDVVNVDPGMEARGRGWPCDQATMARLNRAFGTQVTLHSTFLDAAPLAQGTFDRVFSISVIEHIPRAELPAIMRRAFELLKPGGSFVITLDLFLDLVPFTPRESNEFGGNVPVRMLAESAPFELAQGDRAELYGFPEFDAAAVLARRETLMVGAFHPALAQLLVLRKPGPGR